MEIEITIRGKATIPDDDLKYVQACGLEELATILYRHGKDIKLEVKVLSQPDIVIVAPPVRHKGRKRKAGVK